MAEKVNQLTSTSLFNYEASSLPLESGKVPFTLELLECVDIETKEKRYLASIGFGSLGQSIELSSENHQREYAELKEKIERGNYKIQIAPGNSLDLLLE